MSDIGGRMKMYEKLLPQQLMPRLPVLCRVDGRSFHNFTDGLMRPFDPDFSALMRDVACYLMAETKANVAYTQSDEISLAWYRPDDREKLFFGGKLQKIISITAAMTTAWFNQQRGLWLKGYKPNELAIFDSRVWQVPTPVEAANYFVWREQDATRNSIQMAARAAYPHAKVQNKNNSELQDMLHSDGINWNDYPVYFKRGTYIRRQLAATRTYTEDEIAQLPPEHHARENPDMIVKRYRIVEEKWPPITQIVNRPEVLLEDADPITYKELESTGWPVTMPSRGGVK